MGYVVSALDLSELTLNEEDTVQSVLQNISVILRTGLGTAPLCREVGLPHEAVDRPIPAVKPLLTAAVREAVERFEPRAEVTAVSFSADPSQPGRLIPKVEVNILAES